MHPEIKIWLKDIELSIKEIHNIFSAHDNYENFRDDLITRKAIERNSNQYWLNVVRAIDFLSITLEYRS